MKAIPLSDKYRILVPGLEVCLQTVDGSCHFHKVRSSRDLGRYLLISFEDITNPTAAIEYRGSLVAVDRESIDLGEGEFFYDQILGLPVFTEHGAFIGMIEDIFPTASNDVYVVRGEGAEYLIPAVRHFIVGIDLTGKRVIVTDVESLRD